tara:strand:- start:355 stop:543 length:189 start_codon:yes stop_codon:yes gene_type:complete
MEKNIKVFVKIEDKIYKRILEPQQYSLNEKGQIILPDNHFSKGYIERIIDDINWDDYPEYEE